LHYQSAVPFLGVAAASLSQAMHGRESGIGPCGMPTLSEEQEAMEFDWERRIAVSARTRQALQFALEVLRDQGRAGQPLWPTVASSFHGAFLRGDIEAARPLVITYDASVSGWGAVLRTTPDEPGRVVVGGFQHELELRGATFLDPTGLGGSPAAQVYRETLAGLLVMRAASQLFALSQHTVLLRGDCVGALAALRKGSFRAPAMQDISMAFNDLMLRIARKPPLFLHAPGDTLKAEGVDALSREVAMGRTLSQSTHTLRALADREARGMSARFTIDLFATADNAVVPRFYARFPEPGAEAVDALAAPDWGQSLCPHCKSPHREFCFVFPPRSLLARTLAKARADGLRGVVVMPFVTSDPMWPAFMAASVTSVAGQLDRCVVVPNSSVYVRQPADLAGAQRLAVFAVDFTRISGRDFSGTTPLCDRALEQRLRAALVAAARDADDRRRIDHELYSLRLQQRAAVPDPTRLTCAKRQRR
jgi:hypothetical protein